MPSRRTSTRLAVGVAVLVVAAGGAAASYAAVNSGPSGYRTATVSRATVRQTLDLTGTLTPVADANVSFPISGTVATVNVKEGQQVADGQTLATLDTTTLRAQVTAARGTLATAQAKLASDEAAQASGSTSTSSSTATTPSSTSTSGTARAPSGAATGLAAAQRAVTTAQKKADTDLAAARRTLQAELNACPALTGPSTAGGSPSAAGTTSPDATPSTTATATPTPSPNGDTGTGAATSCTTAAQSVLNAQQQVSRDQQQVAQLEASLTRLVGAAATTASTTSTATTPAATSPTSTRSGTGSSGSSASVTAADLAADQAAIDAAQAELAVTEQNEEAATLAAPISGTVVAVNVAKGQAASTSTAAFRIVGSSGQQAALTVSDSHVRQLKVGLPATVTPDGTSTPLAAHVASVSVFGTTTSSGTVTYPVVVALDDAAAASTIGADATVQITVATARNVVAVPTSAIHHTGTLTTVTTLLSGKPITTRITTGASGDDLTQVLSGLQVGEQVVLADLSASVPTSSTTSQITRRLTDGGAPAGGFGTGGFGGGTGGFGPGGGPQPGG